MRTLGGGGGSVEIVSSVSPACRKRRLNGAVSRNNRIKRWPRVGAWTGMLRKPAKCLWRWEPDRRLSSSIRLQMYVTSLKQILPPWGRRWFRQRIHPPYPQRVVKGDSMGRRYIALVADTA